MTEGSECSWHPFQSKECNVKAPAGSGTAGSEGNGPVAGGDCSTEAVFGLTGSV